MGRRPERLGRLERLPSSRRRRLRKGKEPAPRRGRVEVANTLTPPIQVTSQPISRETSPARRKYKRSRWAFIVDIC